MNLNPLTWDWDQWKAAGKHGGSIVAGGVGALVAVHFLSPQQGMDLGENVNHVINGLTEVAKGVAGILAIVGGAYTTLRSTMNASPEVRKAAVSQQPNEIVVTTTPANKIELANKIADMPEAKQVLSTPAVAAATPSPKVVAPTK